MLLARRLKTRWVADVRYGWLFEPHKPQMANPLRRAFEGWLERMVFISANFVTFITKTISEDASARFPEHTNKSLYVSSGFLPNTGRETLWPEGDFVLGYCGRIALSDHRRGIADLTQEINLFLEKVN